MFNRFKKAFSALLLILLITLGCLAFMPWRMNEVIPELADTQKCIILRYHDGVYAAAYPKDEALTQLAEVLGSATGHFDRKRSDIHYNSDAPLYRIYLWDSTGKLPEVWVCSTQFFYENTQYVLDEEDSLLVNAALQSCFN